MIKRICVIEDLSQRRGKEEVASVRKELYDKIPREATFKKICDYGTPFLTDINCKEKYCQGHGIEIYQIVLRPLIKAIQVNIARFIA